MITARDSAVSANSAPRTAIERFQVGTLSKARVAGAAANPMGLRYSRRGSTLNLETNVDGFLYLLQSAPDGGLTLIIPDGMRVSSHTAASAVVPAGIEVTLVLSKAPISDPAAVAKSRQRSPITSTTGDDHFIVAPTSDVLVTTIGAAVQ
jgi:hypothetical protein